MTKATRDALVKVYGTLTRAGWDRAGTAEASPAQSPTSQPSIAVEDGPFDHDLLTDALAEDLLIEADDLRTLSRIALLDARERTILRMRFGLEPYFYCYSSAGGST